MLTALLHGGVGEIEWKGEPGTDLPKDGRWRWSPGQAGPKGVQAGRSGIYL